MTRIFLTPFAALALAAPTVLAGPIIAPVITLDLPELPVGKTLTIEYDTTVGPLNGNTTDLSTQATVTADGGINIQSVDPAIGSGPTLTGVFENTPPTLASSTAGNVGAPEEGLTSYSFQLDYADATGVDASTIDANDVTVTGPGGLIPVTAGTTTDPDGTLVTATYTITPPGGSWDSSDNGTYTIGLVGMEVGDTGTPPLFVAASANATTFVVNIPTPSYTIVATDASKAEGNTGTTNFTFTVNRGGNTSVAGSVAYSITGADPADFTSPLTGTIPFPPATPSVTLTVQVTGDSEVEADEAFNVTLSAPLPGGTVISTPSSAGGNILNDDASYAVAAFDAEKPETNSGNQTYTFRITRSGFLNEATTVDWAVTGSGGNPADATDFGGSLPSGTATFNPGDPVQTVPVSGTGDSEFEPDEGFTVTISSPSSGSITTGTADITIQNDDTLTVDIAADDADADENTADAGNFRISRNASSGTLTVDIQLAAASTATAAADFSLGGVMLTGGAGTVTIPDGQTFIDISLTPNPDEAAEASETATLQVIATPGYAVGTSEDTVTIAANDTVVTNTGDFDPATDANGGEGTIRQAIINANAIPGPQTITFSDADGIPFTATPQTITLTTGQLQLTQEADISGPALPGMVTIDAAGGSRVINVQGGGGPSAPTYTLSRLTISGGQTPNVAGGILVEFSNIILQYCVVQDNTGSSGGGLYIDEGNVRITRSIIQRNSALGSGGRGGGVYISNSSLSTVRMRGSTLADNQAFIGGAIWLGGNPPFAAVNCTVSGNSAREEGGGIALESSSNIELNHVTITDNHADSDISGDPGHTGGGIASIGSGPILLSNSIIAGNVIDGASPSPSDVRAPLNPASNYNLIGVDTALTGITDGNGGNQIGTSGSPIDPLLDPLADNGGRTQTHALLPGSPAINTGDPAFDPNSFMPPLTFDQRGPGFDRIATGRLDIGAFETEADLTPPMITCPPDLTIECDQSTDPANTGMATAIDDIDLNPVVTFTDVNVPGVGGDAVITRTWTATDAAGNSASCVQTITVQDTTPPAIICPADVTIECDRSTDPSATGSATATDNCDPAPVITFSDLSAPGAGDNVVITRIWTATDANGNFASCDQIITIERFRPTLVGTGIPNQSAIEDNAPISIPLVGFFADSDQDVATLTYSVETNDNGSLVTTDVSGITLTLTLGADQTGTANLTVRATDECGLFVDSPFVLTVTKQIDLGVTGTESVEVVAAGSGLPGNLVHVIIVTNKGPSDATGVILDITGTLPAGVTLDSSIPTTGTATTTSWTGIDLAEGASATLMRTFSVAASASGGIDVISTDASVSGASEPIVNPGDDAGVLASSIISPADVGTLKLDVSPVLSLQSGLFTQRVTVTNNNPLPIAGLRLSASNLPADVALYNAHGNSGGLPYVDYNEALAPGASVELDLEFFRPNLDGNFDPVYEVSEVRTEDPGNPPVATTGFAIDRTEILANGDFLIEFTGNPGAEYAVEYSANGTDWTRAVPSIIAPANKVQWIDNGPPKTASHPGTAGIRLYRVVLIPTP